MKFSNTTRVLESDFYLSGFIMKIFLGKRMNIKNMHGIFQIFVILRSCGHVDLVTLQTPRIIWMIKIFKLGTLRVSEANFGLHSAHLSPKTIVLWAMKLLSLLKIKKIFENNNWDIYWWLTIKDCQVQWE